jgi:hypothetical protein
MGSQDRWYRWLYGLLGWGIALSMLFLLLPMRARAATFVFTKIADSTGPVNTFREPSINTGGTVVFWAHLDTGISGIFTGIGGPITSIADTSGPFSGFDEFPFINDGGRVAFRAGLDTGGEGIFIGSGGPTTVIATTGGTFNGFAAPTINNGGTVAFPASLSVGGNGIFIDSGGQIATLYDTSGTFSGFLGGSFPINDGGTAAFRATLDAGGEGIFSGSGGTPTTIADTSAAFSSFSGPPSINDGGTVAFRASLGFTGISGIFKGSGGPLTTIADTSGPFGGFGEPSINRGGTVAFWALLDAGGEGIFTGPDPVADKVISTGDLLFGSTVTALGVSRVGLNDAGEVAFRAMLSDGTIGIYRADPVPSVVTVNIDINPGSDPNTINPRSRGRIPVAILTTDSFDATSVDPTTALFGATGTEAAPVHFALEDVDADGNTDMILHFNTKATGIQCGVTSASLTGKTFDGQMIQGSDSIRTAGCK